MDGSLKQYTDLYHFARIDDRVAVGVHKFARQEDNLQKRMTEEVRAVNALIHAANRGRNISCRRAHEYGIWNVLQINDTSQLGFQLDETPLGKLVDSASWSAAFSGKDVIAYLPHHKDALLFGVALQYLQIIPRKGFPALREAGALQSEVHVPAESVNGLYAKFPREKLDLAKPDRHLDSFLEMRLTLLELPWGVKGDGNFQGPIIEDHETARRLQDSLELMIFKPAGLSLNGRSALTCDPLQVDALCQAIPQLRQKVRDAQTLATTRQGALQDKPLPSIQH